MLSKFPLLCFFSASSSHDILSTMTLDPEEQRSAYRELRAAMEVASKWEKAAARAELNAATLEAEYAEIQEQIAKTKKQTMEYKESAARASLELALLTGVPRYELAGLRQAVDEAKNHSQKALYILKSSNEEMLRARMEVERARIEHNRAMDERTRSLLLLTGTFEEEEDGDGDGNGNTNDGGFHEHTLRDEAESARESAREGREKAIRARGYANQPDIPC